MARYDDRNWDDDRRDRRHAHGRYSGAQAGDDRHRQERWRHGGYGSDWQPGRDTDRDYGMDRGDYYDPDHEYRSRRYQRDSDREEPYAERPMPGEHADRQRDRRIPRSRPTRSTPGQGRAPGSAGTAATAAWDPRAMCAPTNASGSLSATI